MKTSDMIRQLCGKMNITVSELARRLGQSPQNFGKKLKRETITLEELKTIADVMDVKFEQAFILPDGEEDLMKKESYTYALFEYNPERAIAVNLEGKIIAVNREQRISGDRLPIIGDLMYRDYASNHEIDMYSELMACMGSRMLKVFPELKYRGKFLSITIAPFSAGAVIISRDITDRKRAEETEVNFQHIIQNAPVGIFKREIEGKYHYFNQRLVLQFECESEEEFLKNYGLISQRWVHPEQHDEFKELLHKNRSVNGYEVELKLISGATKWFSLHAFLDDSNTLINGFSMDITERKLAEEALRESVLDLEKKNNFINTILENLAFGLGVNFIDSGVTKYTNPAYSRVYGWPAEDMKDIESFFKLIYPDPVYSAQRMKMVMEDINSGDPERMHWVGFMITTKNGEERFIEARNIPLPDQNLMISTAWDITEHKLAEEKLRESFDRLSLATRAGGMGIWDYDIVNNKMIWDAQMYSLYGITRDTFGGDDEIWRAAVHQEDMQRIDDEIQMSLRGEKEFDTEFRIVWPDGTIRNIRALSTIQRDSFAKPLRMIGMNKDITEEKQAVEALARLNLQNELILNSAAEGILGLDLQGNHTFVNPAAAKMLGYASEELIGQPSHSYWHHSRSDGSPYPMEDCPILKTALKGVEHRESNAMFWRKDCTGFPTEYVSTPILEQGQVTGVVVTFSDMTERKRAEEELRESELRFMNVLYSSADAILLVDGGQIVDCNEATTRMLGYSDRNEFMMTHPSELSPPTQPDGSNSFEKANEMMRIASERGFHQFEWEHRRVDGELFPVQVSLTSIVLHGKNVIYSMWRDITERKRTAEELQRTLERLKNAINTTIQVLVSAVEVKDPYTGGHQLRTANLARAIAMEMELSPNIIDGIRMAGSIHDLGKLSIPSEILSKPTKLTPIEFSLIKEHSQNGYEMLKDVESPWPLAEIVYQHHERMDGCGYPRNLKGDEILMEARIIAVADVVESMSSHRPYRPALGIDAALNEIETNRGTNYDNDVVDACLRLFREKGFLLEASLT